MISVMRNGGKIALLGISNKAVDLDMNTIIIKGLNLQGVYDRKIDNGHQMSYMVQGGLDVSSVTTHCFHETDLDTAMFLQCMIAGFYFAPLRSWNISSIVWSM